MRPVGLEPRTLAQEAGVGIVTIRQLEAGLTEPRRATIEVVRQSDRLSRPSTVFSSTKMEEGRASGFGSLAAATEQGVQVLAQLAFSF